MKRRDLLVTLGALPAMQQVFAMDNLKQAKLLVGQPAGSATDGLARLLGERMRGLYAENFVVENRVGASGQLAVVATKAAPADGTNILVSPIMVLTVVPHTFESVAFNPFTDLLPVGDCVTTDLAIAVGPAVPASVTNVQQFIAWCKQNPGKASFGTGATGTKIHFSGIRLGQLAGVELTHVGYANGGGALTDLAGGTIPAYIGLVPTVMPFLNRIRVLATMGAQRSRFFPSVPTLVESGYKDLVINESISLYLPAKTPEAQVLRLNSAMVKAITSPEAASQLTTLGMEATPSGATEYKARIKAEYDEWGTFVRKIGFKQTS